ncbi:hypothetical protein ACH9L7_06465 [Haloferax sp. S1W]|uniref:hypothetical protein n=1 Tax=Haloferax sp. S1W TaxID=3377110 RepID=UPI0037CBAB0D
MLRTPTPVTPTLADETRFWFPTDAAVCIETSGFETTGPREIIVRDSFGTMVAQAGHGEDIELEAGTYSLELFTSVKAYIQVTSSLRIEANTDRTKVEFSDEVPVYVGARSYHRSPAATITTTDDPRDLMRAISTFGSALKTTSVERSYPTLRGHPPLLEVGDKLDIPTGIEPPDTGVVIEVPPKLEYIVVAAPLVYYLGAKLEPGQTPRIVSDDFVHELDTPQGFEAEVERVLKQTFFLDCVTRTEGYYQVDLHERSAVETRTDLDFTELYHADSGERLGSYLEISFDTLSDLMPEWKLTTHVQPRSSSLELLPFVTDDLAVVKTPQVRTVTADEFVAESVNDFLRDETFTRSTSTSSDPVQDTFIKPERAESAEQAWIGDGAPVGASKPTREAYKNRLTRTAKEGAIDIVVVCNDPEMSTEGDVVDEVYGSRAELPFDVTYHEQLTTDELQQVLSESNDFLHYVGHIDDDGFECADGKLDAKAVDSTGADAFLLNACRSYEQGLSLIDSGSIGGIVTLDDVLNVSAVEVGGVLAQLLNMGFPLQTALNVVQRNSDINQPYTIVGDGEVSISQTASGMATICEVETVDKCYELTFKTYPTVESNIGALVKPAVAHNDEHYLLSSDEAVFELDREELEHFLQLEQTPVFYRSELYWGCEFLDSV